MNKIIKNASRLILVFAFIYLLFFFWVNKERYVRPYDYTYFGNLYSESQYVKGELTKGGIGDDGLYAFAGYYYIRGGDVSQVNFENPPLGKYLIGLSILLFNNERAINILYSLLLLFVVYHLAHQLTKNSLLSSVAASILSVDPLVTSQHLLSMLDIPMIVFFITGIIFYIKAAKSSKPLVLLIYSSLFFSISFATRFFPILPLILVVLTLGLRKKGKRYFLPFFISWCIFLPLVYLLSYIMYFFYHPSFWEFLRYQNWIIHWRLQNPIKFGNIFSTLLFGRYQTWWENPVWLVSSDWTVLTGIITIVGFVGLIRWFKRYPHKILTILCILYVVYLAIGTVGVAKFILPVYPILIICAVDTFFVNLRGILTKHG